MRATNVLLRTGFVALTLLASACESAACVPGETQACFGPGQCAGVQVCNSAGTQFLVCNCGEMRDAGPRPDSGPPSDGGSSSGVRRVFVTSAGYTGSITRAGTVDGIDSADAYCTLHAEAAGIGGLWKAFLSDSVEDAIDRIPGSGPWVNMEGEELFSGRAALEVSEPTATIGYDETGAAIFSGDTWWTGSTSAGRHEVGNDCAGFTSDNDFTDGAFGRGGNGRSFANSSSGRCQTERRLLCFER